MQIEYGREYSGLYREHWWWRARETILLDEFRRIGLRTGGGLEILDVGCGDALFFPTLTQFGHPRGIEIDERLLDPDGPFRNQISIQPLGDPCYEDPSWRFDLITALDVVEHIEDDRNAIASIVRMLRPGGLLLVTVPAFEFLWDELDELNCHHRRYTVGGLKEILNVPELELVRIRYAFRSLFLPKLLIRWVNEAGFCRVAPESIPPTSINRIARQYSILEDRLLNTIPLPFGTSVFALARRV